MELRRELSFRNVIMQPAAGMHHPITCAATLLRSCSHNTQCGITKHNYRVRIEALTAELRPYIAAHLFQSGRLNVQADAITCSYSARQLSGDRVERLRMLFKFFEPAGLG